MYVLVPTSEGAQDATWGGRLNTLKNHMDGRLDKQGGEIKRQMDKQNETIDKLEGKMDEMMMIIRMGR